MQDAKYEHTYILMLNYRNYLLIELCLNVSVINIPKIRRI